MLEQPGSAVFSITRSRLSGDLVARVWVTKPRAVHWLELHDIPESSQVVVVPVDRRKQRR
jgi:hypothetical protein